MKTQRMDAEYKRLQEEITRRELQRKLFYENKRDAHKKLYSRVLSKNFLSGIEESTMKFFTETSKQELQDYFRDEVKEEVEGSFYDWLIDNTCQQIDHEQRIRKAANRIVERVPFDLRLLHRHYLNKEEQRILGIMQKEAEKQRRFEEERAARRAHRHLLRVSRTKRRLKEEIEAKIYSKKSLEGEILGLKLVTFSDQDPEIKKFRTYGGILYEIWSVLSYAREAVNTKVDPPLEKFLVQDDDIKKFLMNFLSDPVIKEKGIRLDLNEKYKAEIEAALHHMDTDLLTFNEVKEEIIGNLLQHNDLVVSMGIEYCIAHGRLEQMAYHWLLVNLLRIFFKSNDYKVAEDTAPFADDDKKDNVADQSLAVDGGNTSLPVPDPKLIKQGSQNSGTHQPAPGDELSILKSAGTGGRRKSHSKLRTMGPEITEEDRRIEALKKKLDIHFVPSKEEISKQTVAIFRIRESLNREALRPEVEKQIQEEKERKKQEAEAIHDPKKHIDYHRKPYLLEEYLGELKANEESAKKAQEDEELKKKEAHIEQYYGDVYEKEFKNYDFDEVDRAPTNINETLSLDNDREVLFIHRVNQGLFRKAILEKMRESFKEITLIKDIDLDKRILPLDKHIEHEVLSSIVKDKDKLPVFDVEL